MGREKGREGKTDLAGIDLDLQANGTRKIIFPNKFNHLVMKSLSGSTFCKMFSFKSFSEVCKM